MNTLPVPYFAQLGPSADEHHNDCLAGSVAMLAGAYKRPNPPMTIDQIYNAMQPQGDQALFISQGMVFLSSQGIQTDLAYLVQPHDLFDILYTRKPVIALIHYGTLVSAKLTQFVDFIGAHFVVVVGMDIENIFINDPYHTDGKGLVAIPITTMMMSWRDASLDDNPQYSAIVPRLPITDLSGNTPKFTDYTVTVNLMYVHSGPLESSPIVGTAAKGEIQHILNNSQSGNYVQRTDGRWLWLGFLIKGAV
jgi:hypothetical protein